MKTQGMAGRPGKEEVVRMLLQIIDSADSSGSGASLECAEVVDVPGMAAELLRMILSLYGVLLLLESCT